MPLRPRRGGRRTRRMLPFEAQQARPESRVEDHPGIEAECTQYPAAVVPLDEHRDEVDDEVEPHRDRRSAPALGRSLTERDRKHHQEEDSVAELRDDREDEPLACALLSAD